MTISSTNSKAIFTTSTAVSNYAYNFKVFAARQLRVTIVDATTRATTDLTLTTDYSVSGVGTEAGGAVVLTAAGRTKAGNGNQLVILRNMEFTQETDYQPHDIFPAETHEEALDTLTMMCQELKEVQGRSVVRDPSESEIIPYAELVAAVETAVTSVDAAAASATDAAASATAAASSANTATMAATDATAAKDEAVAARDAAEGYRDEMVGSVDAAAASASLAQTAASDATISAISAADSAASALQTVTTVQASAELAKQWATNPLNVEVEAGKFSAYHWAQMAQGAATGGILEATQEEANEGAIGGSFISPILLGELVPDRSGGKFGWLIDPASVAALGVDIADIRAAMLTANDIASTTNTTSTDKLETPAGAQAKASLAFTDATNWAGANLTLKADIANPTFTGIPSAPTAAYSTSTAQIATTAFVQDMRTSYGLLTATKVLSTAGYLKLGNGFMMQWGVITRAPSLTAYTVSFYTAFPSACFSVAMGDGTTGAGHGWVPRCNSVSRTGFSLRSDYFEATSITMYCYYIAIGY